MAKLQPYQKYYPVAYDYASQLPDGWLLLPNIAIFQERKERGTENEETLSISAIRGIVKSSDYENRKDRTSDDKSQYLLVKEGDLAYNTMLMWDGAVGHSAFRGIVSPAYTVLKAKMKINPKYFHYQMRTEFYKNYSRRFSYGIVDARLRLYYVHFKRMYSIVPPLEVQNSIAAYLDKKNNEIDKFIRNKERLIELLEEQLLYKINEALIVGLNQYSEFKTTTIANIPKIPIHWEIKKFKWLTSILSCGYASTPEYVDEEKGVAFLSAQNCRPFKMDFNKFNYISSSLHKKLTQNKKPKRGDVLVTRVGAGIGDACVVDTDLEFSVYVSLTHIRTTKEILSDYVVYFFKTQYCIQLNSEGTIEAGGQGNLNVKNVEKYRIPLPPINEQKEICKYLDIERAKINTAISKAQKEISAIIEYREALITDLVTGKRKVSEL
ncbi:MAG: restriction endonuclease subunit S [Candidatus Kapabacteria bacterium]|nr:restriction endonuclease subunit S [Candidatus Kapabacteria bacterium]